LYAWFDKYKTRLEKLAGEKMLSSPINNEDLPSFELNASM
jgi:hypothetical protein